jgi:serine protease
MALDLLLFPPMASKIRFVLLFVLSIPFLLPSFGCGQTPFGLTSADGKLSGQWVAEKLSATGDRILLTITPGNGERQVQVTALRPLGDSYIVAEGSYSIGGNEISFSLDEIPGFTSSFVVDSTRLILGTDVYYKVSGSLDGPQLGGQIQISSSASDESVTTSSLAVSPVSASRIVPREFLVKYKDGTVEKIVLEEDETLFDEAAAGPSSLTALSLRRVGVLDELKKKTIRQVEEYRKDPGVEYAVPNVLLKTQSLADPTDTLFDDQWNLEILQITEAWGETTAASEVVVAVIDTGIVSHPDLAGRVLFSHGYDFVHDSLDGVGDLDLDAAPGPDADPTDPCDQQNMGLPDGCSWHGTHISGIIAASIDNGTGVAGIARNVKILPLRAMGKGGNGTVEDVAQAIYYAAKLPNIAECGPVTVLENGGYSYNETTWTCHINTARPKARVINLSLGAEMSAVEATPLSEAIAAASSAGVLVVASAGNAHKNSPNFYPAVDPNVLAIGAVTPSLAFAGSYSNYGNSQFLVAPGGSSSSGILSTINPTTLGGYGRLVGTSQAAAHVTAVAAMMLSEKPALTPAQLKEMLRLSATDLGTAGKDVYYGYGLVNPCGAVLAAKGISPTDPASLKLSSGSVDFGTLGGSTTILVTSGCGGAAATGVTAAKSTASGGNWLEATLSGATTPAQLTLKVNRSGLEAGDYTGSVTVNSAAGNRTIQVTMRVGSTTVAGGDEGDTLREEIEDFLSGTTGFKNTVNIGEVQLLLVNAESGEAVARTNTDLTGNYRFQFVNVRPGKYYILGGVDENGDGTICNQEGDSGEPCFAYPNLSGPETIEVTSSTKKNDLVLVY